MKTNPEITCVLRRTMATKRTLGRIAIVRGRRDVPELWRAVVNSHLSIAAAFELATGDMSASAIRRLLLQPRAVIRAAVRGCRDQHARQTGAALRAARRAYVRLTPEERIRFFMDTGWGEPARPSAFGLVRSMIARRLVEPRPDLDVVRAAPSGED